MEYGDLIYYKYIDSGDYGDSWVEDAEIRSKENDYYFNAIKNHPSIKIIAVIPKEVYEKYLVKE